MWIICVRFNHCSHMINRFNNYIPSSYLLNPLPELSSSRRILVCYSVLTYDWLPVCAGRHICQGARGFGMPQQHLGADNEERFAEVAHHLTAQGVEVLRRCGRVDNVQVHVVTWGGGGGGQATVRRGPILRSRRRVLF